MENIVFLFWSMSTQVFSTLDSAQLALGVNIYGEVIQSFRQDHKYYLRIPSCFLWIILGRNCEHLSPFPSLPGSILWRRAEALVLMVIVTTNGRVQMFWSDNSDPPDCEALDLGVEVVLIRVQAQQLWIGWAQNPVRSKKWNFASGQ